MIRGEYVMRHSGHYIRTYQGRRWLRDYLSEIAAAFYPQPVWYRISDFEPREIGTLVGADVEVSTENPLMAARGLRRGLQLPDAFEQELRVVVETSSNHRNLHLLFSFVGTELELCRGVQFAKELGFTNHIGTMIETPSAAIDATSLAKHVTHFVVGLNDLTSFFFAAERNSPFAQKDHPLIIDLLLAIKKVARENGLTIFVAGDFDSSLLQKLDGLEFDALVLHYTNLPMLLGPEFSDLKEIDLVPRLKQEMAASLQVVYPLTFAAIRR